MERLTTPSPDGRVWLDPEMGLVEAVVPPGPWPTAHGPGLLETPSGAMLCCWFAGTYEGAGDVRVVAARLEPGSGRWGDPVPVSPDDGRSHQNPSLFAAPDGSVWCLYTSQEPRREGKDNMQFTAVVMRQVSRDGGRSWSEPEVFVDEPGTFVRQPIQVLSSGRWALGTWLCRDGPRGLADDPSAVRVSDDGGATWRRVMVPGSAGRVHPTLVEPDPGHLVCLMRSRRADWIWRSESWDDGDRWSEPEPTELPNNNSGLCALRLASGRVAVAYNHSSAPGAMGETGAWPGLRCPVSVALSEDGCRTFPLIRHVERGQGFAGPENVSNNLQYEYPSLVQASDGMLHLAYAFETRRAVKWVSLSEGDVAGRRRGAATYNPTSGEVPGAPRGERS